MQLVQLPCLRPWLCKVNTSPASTAIRALRRGYELLVPPSYGLAALPLGKIHQNWYVTWLMTIDSWTKWSRRIRQFILSRRFLTRWFKPSPLYPVVGGHDSPLKGSLNHPKKVTKNCQEPANLQSSTWMKLKCRYFGTIISTPHKIKMQILTQAIVYLL